MSASSFHLIFHLFLHVLVPFFVVVLFYREKLWKSYLIMMSTMLVDLDHLLATPILDPNRCSIGFHPLHCTIPIVIYALLCFFPKTRLIGLGLSIHMVLDYLYC